MNSRDLLVTYIVSLFVFVIIFRFLRTLSMILILDEGCMCCSMEIQNNTAYKYITYSLATYHLNLMNLNLMNLMSLMNKIKRFKC